MSTTPTEPTERDFWDRSVGWWHAAFVGVVVIAAVVAALDDEVSVRRRLVAVALAGAVLLAYAVAGRHRLGRDRVDVVSLGYLVVAWAAVLVMVTISGAGFLLLFVLFPQTWAMLPRGAAIGVTLAACSGIALVELADDGEVGSALTTAGVNLGFSLLLGLWITGVIDESESRRRLIDDLERTRDELATTERARGVLAERQRLAAEIHDTIAQGLTSIIALAQAIEATLDRDPAAARERLALLQATARADLAEARALVADLGPADLDGAPLPEAVRRLVERTGLELGVPAELVVTGEPHALGADAEVVLLRSAQEALANVRKHAGACRVVVRLAYEGPGAALEVVDDGRGFDPTARGATAPGFGLPGMRRRVAELGGRMLVDSAVGAGTRLRVELP